MTATTIRVQMAQRKDTAAGWTAANPILLSGEIGYETDTKKFKIGNGSTNWNSLAYLPIPDGSGNLTITGNLEIGTTGSLTFEGSTADGFETTLAVTNPTADRTITLPNVTGTVITSGDTGSVTSTMLADGTIVNADINSAAEIAVSKLANGTANQVIVTDGTNVSWSDNLTLAGDLTVNGTTTTINTQDLLVEDKNIIIGNVATPTDLTADGGGITLKGATDKTINWVDSTDAWTSSERFSYPLGSATAPSLTFTGDPNTGIYSPGADQVAISTNGTGRLTVDSAGRVGIGTVSAGERLFVDGDIGLSFQDWRIWTQFDNSYRQGIRVSASTRELSLFSTTNDSGGIIAFYTRVGAGSSSTDYGSERMRLDSSGRLGLGTSSVQALLHLNGAFGSSTTANALSVRNGSAASVSNIAQVDFWCANTFGGNEAVAAIQGLNPNATANNGGAIAFAVSSHGTATTPSERMRLTPTGLGIGTTSPEQSLSIVAPSTAQAIGVWNRASDNIYGGIYFKTNNGATDQSSILNERAGTNGASLLFYTKPDGGSTTERARIDSSGRLLVGTSTARSWSGVTSLLQLEGTNVNGGSFSLSTNTNDANGSFLSFIKSRGTSLNSNTVIQNDDILGAIYFNGTDGNSPVQGAVITARVDGTPGNNDLPSRLVFSTTADGASSPTERLRITSDAYVRLASGTGGIQFNGDTAAANALDDYEEGTWTPTATPSTSGTITLGSITASYTKVGNTVSIRADATVSAVSSPLGYIDISLPFTNSGNAAGSVFFYNGDTGAQMSNFIGRVSGNVFRITYGTGQAGAPSAPYARANTEITLTAVYRN